MQRWMFKEKANRGTNTFKNFQTAETTLENVVQNYLSKQYLVEITNVISKLKSDFYLFLNETNNLSIQATNLSVYTDVSKIIKYREELETLLSSVFKIIYIQLELHRL